MSVQAIGAPSERHELFERLIALVSGAGRADLGERLREAWSAAGRVDTTVAVVDAATSAPSRLIDALLDRADVPDRTVPSVLHARIDIGGGQAASGPAAILARGTSIAEVAVDHPLLASGLRLIDAPALRDDGAGADELLNAVVYADCTVFVTTAESPLTSSQLGFLARAANAGCDVIVVLGQVDAFDGWRGVLTANRELLRAAGVTDPITLAMTRKYVGIDALRARIVTLARQRFEADRRSRLSAAATDVLRELADAAGGHHLLEAHQRTSSFLKRNRVGGLVLVDELTSIQEDAEFALGRGLSALRRRYEPLLGSEHYRTRSEAESHLEFVEASLNQEIVALGIRLSRGIDRAFEELSSRFAAELDVALPQLQTRARPMPLGVASEAAPAWTSVPPPAHAVEIGQSASSFWWWAFTGPFGRMGSFGIFGSLFGLLGGTALSFGRWRQSGRMHAFQLGRLMLTNTVEEARTELTPLLRKQFRATRRTFEDGLLDTVADRSRRVQAVLQEADGRSTGSEQHEIDLLRHRVREVLG